MIGPVTETAAAILEEGGKPPEPGRREGAGFLTEHNLEKQKVRRGVLRCWALVGLLSLGAAEERRESQTKAHLPLPPTPYTVAGITPSRKGQAEPHLLEGTAPSGIISS